jgi:hypothetical protein
MFSGLHGVISQNTEVFGARDTVVDCGTILKAGR